MTLIKNPYILNLLYDYRFAEPPTGTLKNNKIHAAVLEHWATCCARSLCSVTKALFPSSRIATTTTTNTSLSHSDPITIQSQSRAVALFCRYSGSCRYSTVIESGDQIIPFKPIQTTSVLPTCLHTLRISLCECKG